MVSRTAARSPALAVLVAAVLTFTLPSIARAIVHGGEVVPPEPTTCDSLLLAIAGSLPSPCYEVVGYRISDPEPLPNAGPIPAYRIHAVIHTEQPGPEEIVCPTVTLPYRVTRDFGRLPFGIYQVEAHEYLHQWPASTGPVVDSSRVDFRFDVRPSDVCSTAVHCVLMGFGPLEPPRLDGCSARALPGQTACLDVTLMNPVPVAGLQTEIQFARFRPLPGDPDALFKPVAVEAIPPGFQVGWTAEGSTAKIVLYSATGATISPGHAAVLHVCFDVSADAPVGEYPIRFGPTLVSSARSEALPFCPTFAEITGSICVGPPPAPECDLNGDGASDVRDIVRLVWCVLSPHTEACPDAVLALADCNGDGSVDIRDVICCVRRILGDAGAWGPTTPGAGPIRIGFEGTIDWSNPVEGNAFVEVAGEGDFGGIQFQLDAGAAGRVKGVALVDDPAGIYSLEWEPARDGRPARVMLFRRGLSVAASGTQPGAGQVVPLPLRVRVTVERPTADGTQGALAITSFHGSTSDGASLGVSGGVLSVPLTVLGVAAILPARPNPFVSETDIAFYLAAPARASLRLYDVRGRLVRTLHDGPAGAGAQHVRWDGRDDRSRASGAGIYFVRLEVGTTVRVDRILRLR